MTVKQLAPKLYNWASILEDNTRAQAEATSSMPFIFPHLALMPDAHLGKGATVGSVIPTLGAIMPAAVGVDIGCVDAESEYLSPTGWRRIADYTGGQVMQYDPADGTGRFVHPKRYIVKDCPTMYRLTSKYGVDQLLSPDHRMLLWQIKGRTRRREQVTMTAAEFTARDRSLKQGFKAEFKTTFSPVLDTKLDMSDDELRVYVMASADSTLDGSRAVLHLSKLRKIERARSLLFATRIDFTERVQADGTSVIRFTPPVLDKSLTRLWSASPEQLAVVADEVLLWDGNADERCYYSRDRGNADFVQYAFTATGSRGVLRADEHYRDGATDYRVYAQTNTMVGMAGDDRTPIEEVSSPDGKAYCFTVPSGYWVMRRGGNVVMTGNCGMAAVRTQWTADEMRAAGDLAALRKAIERAVPLSAGKYNTELTQTAAGRVHALGKQAETAKFDPEAYAGNWALQLGSLGSGNHFIEVTADETGRVWLFLHSGSRGVGNKIATHHIKVAQELAKKWWIQLPDRDLAYLVEGTDEFWAYIRQMRWAQDFALENRAEMMDRVMAATAEHMGEPVAADEVVQCHHNYTMQERVYGKDVWLSRKGAINAAEGVPGLIPGSMGTASYVVVGKGNRLALNSSPHGAGRNYSRSAARKQFTHEQLAEAMAGIEWSGSAEFIDEIPSAYKDIDQVMVDAAELVEVRHTLRQLINVKGD